MKLLVGTTNPGKVAEVESVLEDLSIEIIPLSHLKTWPNVVEDGNTFEENALKKARTWADFSGYVTLADDSGLEVDALGGAPGVRSARYSGEEGDDAGNNEKLLHELAGLPEERRRARFVCVLALCTPGSMGGRQWVFRAHCAGRITFAPKGTNGFGYDPLFFYPPLGKTFAELDRATKCTVSHRGRALLQLKEALPGLLDLKNNP